MNKKNALITFASAATLLGLFISNNQVHADTVEQQPATNQTTIQNDSKQDNSAIAVDQNDTQNQNDAADKTNGDINESTLTTDNNNFSFSDTSYNNYDANQSSTSNTNQDNYGLNSQALQVLQEADIKPATLTKDQIDNINKIEFDATPIDTSTHWSYIQYAGVAKKMIK